MMGEVFGKGDGRKCGGILQVITKEPSRSWKQSWKELIKSGFGRCSERNFICGRTAEKPNLGRQRKVGFIEFGT